VRIDRTRAPAGDQEVRLVVTAAQGGQIEVILKATIQAPELNVEPLELDFGEDRTSLPLTIRNPGAGALNFSIEAPQEGWITLSQTQGRITSSPITIDVRIDRDSAPTGDQEVTLIVTADPNQRIEVTLKAGIRRPAELALSPSTLDFGESAGQQQVTVRNDGGEALDWNAASIQGWISLAPASGTLAPGDQQTVTVSIDRANQPSGSIQGSVDFTSNGGSASVVIQATVPNLPKPAVSPISLDFGAIQTRLSVELRNIGSGVMDWTLEVSDAWIRPTATSGSVVAGDARTIFIEVSRDGLDSGALIGSATFRSAGGDVSVEIIMRVASVPILGLEAPQLDASTQDDFTFSVLNNGSGELNWQLTENEDWLELDKLDGQTVTIPQAVTGTINRSGLQAGAYDAAIRIDSDGGTETLIVTMVVAQPEVEITEGPAEDEVLTADQVTFTYGSINASGQIEFSTKLNDQDWSDWGPQTSVTYENLEESDLAGPHLFQVQVRADAGESEILLRRFQINALQGPTLRLSPKALTTSVGQTVEVDIVAEEVTNLLAARVIIEFDADRLQLQEVVADDLFLTQRGGTVFRPDAVIDNENGQVDLSVGVLGGTNAGVDDSGILAKLRFRARSSGIGTLEIGAGSELRDSQSNPQSIQITTQGLVITIQ